MTEVLNLIPKRRRVGTSAEKRVIPVRFDANGEVHRVTSPQDSDDWIWLAQVVNDARILRGKTSWSAAKCLRDDGPRFDFD